MEVELVGAIKVKDGLFVGDEFAAQDLEFVVANKVTHVVNCAARQVPSHWEPIGVHYLSFYWLEHDSQVLFDAKDEAVARVYNFIDKALQSGESVLIHSVRGQGRCICVTAVYLMKKFRWSLQKSLEFLASRRPDIEVRPSFMQQLIEIERRFVKQALGASSNWNELSEEMNLESEELLLRNTFMNSRMGALADYTTPQERIHTPRINWIDNVSGEGKSLVDVPHPSSKNPVEQGFAIMSSCLKGGSKTETRVPIFGNTVSRGRSEKPKPVGEMDSKLREDLQKLAVQVFKKERPLSAGKKEVTPVKRDRKPRASSAKARDPASKLVVNRAKLGPLSSGVTGVQMQITSSDGFRSSQKAARLSGVKKKRPSTAPNGREAAIGPRVAKSRSFTGLAKKTKTYYDN